MLQFCLFLVWVTQVMLIFLICSWHGQPHALCCWLIIWVGYKYFISFFESLLKLCLKMISIAYGKNICNNSCLCEILCCTCIHSPYEPFRRTWLPVPTLQKTYHNYTGCVLLVLVIVVGCQRKSLSNSHFSCNSNTLFWRASDIVIVDFNAAKLKRKNCPWLSSKHPRTVLLTLGSHRKQKICICEEILKFMDVGVSKTNRKPLESLIIESLNW